ncbi:MAG: hypothetical protein [Bacteriophage sp.]|nr:MAG: hypothetical protein [Bacteriophage sp.]
MRKIKRYVRNKPHVAIGVPAVLCSITFVTNLIQALRDGVLDSAELHSLLSTADGFEAVVLFIVALVLKDKKK